MGGACNTQERYVYSILVEKPEGKRPRGRRGRRWNNITKMELKGIGY
jgi:hypothetical protein